METLNHAIFSCLAPFILPPYAKKSFEYCDFAFADGGNRTLAASAASNGAIHYANVPQQILCRWTSKKLSFSGPKYKTGKKQKSYQQERSENVFGKSKLENLVR